MSESHGAVEVFTEAAKWFSGLVGEIPGDAWEKPGLGEWDLRALVGHTSRALLTAHAALLTADDVAAAGGVARLNSPEDYFLRVAKLPGAGPELVRDRGVAAGGELGDDPAASCARLADTVLTALRESGSPVVQTIAGTMRLHDYLGTRVFELVVHGVDICNALGRVADVPARAELETLLLTARLAARGGHGVDLLLAATGRGPLQGEFSVLRPRHDNGDGGRG